MLSLVENATDVRKHWSEFVDQVAIHNKPKIVSRNSRNPFIAISLEQMETMLHAYRFNVTSEIENDGSFTVSLEDFDFVTNRATLKDALLALADDLIEYAQEYIDEIQVYYATPNRAKHLPYILAVLMKDNREEVVKLFNADI